MKLKLKEHTLSEVLNELTNLYGHGAKKLCVICNGKVTLDGNADLIIDGENVTRVKCVFEEHNKKLFLVIKFEFEPNCKAMKLVDIIRYLERLPVNRSTKVAIFPYGYGVGIKYKYDCKVLDEDVFWNVTVK